MRKFAVLETLALVFTLTHPGSAQILDAAFGFGTNTSPGASACNINASNVLSCPEKGGLYNNVGADVIFHHHLGFGFDALWRASQGDFGGVGQPYRPILFDFNAVYQVPLVKKKAGLDLLGGIGWQTSRYYVGFCTNGFTCNNYFSGNHFLVDVGAGLRYYVWGHLFVRPEVRYYNIFNNTSPINTQFVSGYAFTSNSVVHVGASIGYTIGPD